MSDAEITTADFNAEPKDRFVRLRAALGITSFGLNAIVLEPGQRNRIHRHTGQDEVYVVLEGTLTLGLEDGQRDFGPGAVVKVPPAVRRQLINRGPATVRMLALGGQVDHVHAGRDAEAFADWDTTEPGGPADVPLPDDLPASELRS